MAELLESVYYDSDVHEKAKEAALLESVYYDSDVHEKAKEAALLESVYYDRMLESSFNLYVIEAVMERMLSFIIAEDMVADPSVMLQSTPLTKLDSDVQEKAMQEKASEAAQVKEMKRIRDIEAMKLEEANARRNASAQAKAQAKEMKAKRIRDIEAMKLEEANARWNEQAQAKAQAKEMKAERIRDIEAAQAKAQAKEMKAKRIIDIEAKILRQRDITGEGKEDQNGKAKKARIDEA